MTGILFYIFKNFIYQLLLYKNGIITNKKENNFY